MPWHFFSLVTKLGNRLVSCLSMLFAAGLFLYAGYMLYDTFYLNCTAYATWDLLQYMPDPQKEESPGFIALKEINPDVVGWLTIDGTHVNYPVLHGEDNLHYAYTDVYGNASLNGSIYLATENAEDFADPYIVIYGHHMANGGMFGDLDHFTDRHFLANHNKGTLTTSHALYDLHIYACVLTDAYDHTVYSVRSHSSETVHELESYILEHAVSRSAEVPDSGRIIALSTCSSAVSYGRTVVYAKLTEHTILAQHEDTDGLKQSEAEKVTRKAKGHGTNPNRLSLVNLLGLLLMLYLIVPPGRVRAKYAFRRKNDPVVHMHRSACKQWIGFALEMLLLMIGIVGFLYTESVRDPLTLVNAYTPYILLLMTASLLIDCAVYHPVARRRI